MFVAHKILSTWARERENQLQYFMHKPFILERFFKNPISFESNTELSWRLDILEIIYCYLTCPVISKVLICADHSMVFNQSLQFQFHNHLTKVIFENFEQFGMHLRTELHRLDKVVLSMQFTDWSNCINK